jgi:hypothetical protein
LKLPAGKEADWQEQIRCQSLILYGYYLNKQTTYLWFLSNLQNFTQNFQHRGITECLHKPGIQIKFKSNTFVHVIHILFQLGSNMYFEVATICIWYTQNQIHISSILNQRKTIVFLKIEGYPCISYNLEIYIMIYFRVPK